MDARADKSALATTLRQARAAVERQLLRPLGPERFVCRACDGTDGQHGPACPLALIDTVLTELDHQEATEPMLPDPSDQTSATAFVPAIARELPLARRVVHELETAADNLQRRDLVALALWQRATEAALEGGSSRVLEAAIIAAGLGAMAGALVMRWLSS